MHKASTGVRSIDTGRGISRTALSVTDIAKKRADRIEDWSDQLLFLSTFDRVRQLCGSARFMPLDLELICVELTKNSSVMEAAVIEALASLRAERVRL